MIDLIKNIETLALKLDEIAANNIFRQKYPLSVKVGHVTNVFEDVNELIAFIYSIPRLVDALKLDTIHKLN